MYNTTIPKEKKMKKIWEKCWEEYCVWFCSQWSYAWYTLKTSIIGLIDSVFEWPYAVLGAIFGGLWKLVLIPVGKYIKEKIIAWIEKI